MEKRTNGQWLEAFEIYLKRRYPGRTTAKHYVSDVRIFLKEGQDAVLNVTAVEIDHFVDRQHAQGRAVTTINRRVAALKSFFDFVGEEMGEPERANPVSRRRHAGRAPKQLPRDLSDQEAACFLEVVETRRDKAMVALMLYAGLRVREVTELRGMDITIPGERDAALRLRVMGKGRKERIVYLGRAAAGDLLTYWAERATGDAQEPLFRNRFGRPITTGGVEERVKTYARRSGVKVTCHRLRHTYARWMVEGEVPILALARLMGHTHLQSTQRYIDSADPHLRRKYEEAMEQATAPVKGIEPSAAPPLGSTGPARPGRAEESTVRRQELERFDGQQWQPDWPSWLREGCLAWLDHQWWQWKPSQRKHHAAVRLSQLRIFWTWQLSHRGLQGWEDLQSDDVATFADAQLARGLKANSVRTILDGVYGVLRYLERRGQLTTVPRRPQLALPDALPRHLQPDELLALETYVQRLRLTAHAEDMLDIALYYVLAHAGVRISEALDLLFHDLDLAAQRIYIRDGKGHRDRVVFLTETATAALRAYLATVPHTPEDLLFSLHQRPLSYQVALKRIRRLGVAAGVQGVSPIRLRHTYATTLLNNGLTLNALQRLMGHQDLTTTLIYARLADRTVESQYQAAMQRVRDLTSQLNVSIA
jgi:integrase/recombinase XerC